MTSGRYATDTRVSVERSKAEIEAILARYGADQFMYGWEASRAVIGFRYSGKMVRFILALPTPESDAFILIPTGKRRTATAAEKVSQQAVRQRWRAFTLIVKAKLEAIETGSRPLRRSSCPTSCSRTTQRSARRCCLNWKTPIERARCPQCCRRHLRDPCRLPSRVLIEGIC